MIACTAESMSGVVNSGKVVVVVVVVVVLVTVVVVVVVDGAVLI